MKNLKIKSRKARLIFPLCVVLLSLLTICCNDELKVDKETFFPPKADEESRFDIFYPDSGGFGTKLILKGYNFGTDTNYIKVTVNDKKAKVIRANDNIIYAIVPSRADTGYVRLYLKKGEEFEEFTSETEFRYLFKSNVSTLFGVPGKAAEDNRLDGPYAEALLRRPWQIVTDNDGTIYFVDEGRGQSKNGALRKASNGNVETLVYDNNGVFQSPNGVVFSLNEDTLFIPNRWTGSDVNTDVNIVFSTRDANFVNTKALVTIPKAGTNSVAVHPKTGEVFFDHNSEGAVYRHTGNGNYEKMLVVREGYNDMEMRLLFNKTGDILYIIARKKHCIYRVTYNAATHTFGIPELFAGDYGESGYASGKGTGARFNQPSTPCLDPEGNLLIPDKMNHCIRKITPEGEVTLYAGQPQKSGHTDGLPDKAKFYEPEAVTFSGNALIVADRGNHCVRNVVIE